MPKILGKRRRGSESEDNIDERESSYPSSFCSNDLRESSDDEELHYDSDGYLERENDFSDELAAIFKDEDPDLLLEEFARLEAERYAVDEEVAREGGYGEDDESVVIISQSDDPDLLLEEFARLEAERYAVDEEVAEERRREEEIRQKEEDVGKKAYSKYCTLSKKYNKAFDKLDSAENILANAKDDDSLDQAYLETEAARKKLEEANNILANAKDDDSFYQAYLETEAARKKLEEAKNILANAENISFYQTYLETEAARKKLEEAENTLDEHEAMFKRNPYYEELKSQALQAEELQKSKRAEEERRVLEDDPIEGFSDDENFIEKRNKDLEKAYKAAHFLHEWRFDKGRKFKCILPYEEESWVKNTYELGEDIDEKKYLSRTLQINIALENLMSKILTKDFKEIFPVLFTRVIIHNQIPFEDKFSPFYFYEDIFIGAVKDALNAIKNTMDYMKLTVEYSEAALQDVINVSAFRDANKIGKDALYFTKKNEEYLNKISEFLLNLYKMGQKEFGTQEFYLSFKRDLLKLLTESEFSEHHTIKELRDIIYSELLLIEKGILPSASLPLQATTSVAVLSIEAVESDILAAASKLGVSASDAGILILPHATSRENGYGEDDKSLSSYPSSICSSDLRKSSDDEELHYDSDGNLERENDFSDEVAAIFKAEDHNNLLREFEIFQAEQERKADERHAIDEEAAREFGYGEDPESDDKLGRGTSTPRGISPAGNVTSDSTSTPRGISPAGNATSESTSINSDIPDMPAAAADKDMTGLSTPKRRRSSSLERSSPL